MRLIVWTILHQRWRPVRRAAALESSGIRSWNSFGIDSQHLPLFSRQGKSISFWALNCQECSGLKVWKHESNDCWLAISSHDFHAFNPRWRKAESFCERTKSWMHGWREKQLLSPAVVCLVFDCAFSLLEASAASARAVECTSGHWMEFCIHGAFVHGEFATAMVAPLNAMLLTRPCRHKLHLEMSEWRIFQQHKRHPMVLADQGETAEIFTLPRPEYSQTTNPWIPLVFFPFFPCVSYSLLSLLASVQRLRRSPELRLRS